jgi:hypothetical protein
MITENNFKRVNNDVNGNPRYVFHFLNIADNYSDALKIAKKFGGKKFHNKQYGGGIAIQSYNLKNDCNRINEILTEEN